MHQKHFARVEAARIINERLPCGVSGEIEALHSALERIGLSAFFPQMHHFAVMGGFDFTCRCFRVAVTDKEDSIVRVRDNLFCQGV